MCAAVCGEVSAWESGCRGEQLDIYIYTLQRLLVLPFGTRVAVHVCIDFRKAHDAFGKLSVVCNHVAAPLKVAAVDDDLDEV